MLVCEQRRSRCLYHIVKIPQRYPGTEPLPTNDTLSHSYSLLRQYRRAFAFDSRHPQGYRDAGT